MPVHIIAVTGRETSEDRDQAAFEAFAALHPHEASELEWERFLAYWRRRQGDLEATEEQGRAWLRETENGS